MNTSQGVLSICRQQVGNGPTDQAFLNPSACQIGQRGDHSGHGVWIDQKYVREGFSQGAASLNAGETGADNDRFDHFAVHSISTYGKIHEMQSIRAEIENSLRRHMDNHPLWKEWHGSAGEVCGAVFEMLRTPGKKLRPTLFCLACRAFGIEPLPEMVPAAIALELVHSFILVHDDLMDGSEFRRGAPTLGRRMQKLLRDGTGGGFSGDDLAMVAGDMLYTLAMDSLLSVEADAKQVVAAMRACMKAAMDTGRGALLEAEASQSQLGELRLDEIEKMYALKTGSYTFALPMKLASIFASAQAGYPFDEFGFHSGIAYQLKNDRTTLMEWLNGGATPDDVRDERRTWAMVCAWQSAENGQRQLFASPPGEELKRIFRKCAVLDSLDEVARQHASAAYGMAPSEEIAAYLSESLAI